MKARPCTLPRALPFPFSLRPSPPARSSLPFPAVRSLSSPPRTSPSSLLRRSSPARSPPDVPFSGSQFESFLLVFCGGVVCVAWRRCHVGRKRMTEADGGRLSRCHVPANSLTTLTTRIPRGRRGLVDNWRRAGKLPLFRHIIWARARKPPLATRGYVYLYIHIYIYISSRGDRPRGRIATRATDYARRVFGGGGPVTRGR